MTTKNRFATPPARKCSMTLLAFLVAGLGLAGCGPTYDCVSACEPYAGELATFGRFAPTTEDAVCVRPAIRDASTCGECYAAIRDTHRVGIPELACSCPAGEMDSSIEVVVTDEDCAPTAKPWTVEACFEHNTAIFRDCSIP